MKKNTIIILLVLLSIVGAILYPPVNTKAQYEDSKKVHNILLEKSEVFIESKMLDIKIDSLQSELAKK